MYVDLYQNIYQVGDHAYTCNGHMSQGHRRGNIWVSKCLHTCTNARTTMAHLHKCVHHYGTPAQTRAPLWHTCTNACTTMAHLHKCVHHYGTPAQTRAPLWHTAGTCAGACINTTGAHKRMEHTHNQRVVHSPIGRCGDGTSRGAHKGMEHTHNQRLVHSPRQTWVVPRCSTPTQI